MACGCLSACSAVTSLTPGEPMGEAADLATLRSSGPSECLAQVAPFSRDPLVVAVISPRMVYSMTEWPRMRAAARQAGWRVVTVKAPGLREEEWQGAFVSAGGTSISDGVRAMPTACETEWRGLNHFPYSVVALEGRSHPWPIWGVLPDQEWVESLSFRLKRLQAGLTVSGSTP